MNTISTPNVLTAIESTRAHLLAMVNKACDELAAQITPLGNTGAVNFKQPTLVDGHDLRNKNGLNLTERGVEILFRVFDDGGGYNRAAKMLNITQAAAKNRKAQWVKAGGNGRPKEVLDIDMAN